MTNRWLATALIVALCLAATAGLARAETLQDAWAIALQVNQQLQSQQALSVSAGYSLAAARSARWPTARNLTFNAFLSATPAIASPFSGTSATGGSSAGALGSRGPSGGSVLDSAAATGLPSSFAILGPGQRDLPVSITYASIPLYTGGRLLSNIDAANAQVGSQRAEEYRSALDLKLTVAEAYVGVLRARRNLQTQRSDVDRLTAFGAMSAIVGKKGWRSVATSWPPRSRWPMHGSARSRRGRLWKRPGRPTTATSAGE